MTTHSRAGTKDIPSLPLLNVSWNNVLIVYLSLVALIGCRPHAVLYSPFAFARTFIDIMFYHCI